MTVRLVRNKKRDCLVFFWVYLCALLSDEELT